MDVKYFSPKLLNICIDALRMEITVGVSFSVIGRRQKRCIMDTVLEVYGSIRMIKNQYDSDNNCKRLFVT